MQIIGMMGVVMTIAPTSGWAMRLMLGRIARHPYPPVNEIPMRSIDGAPPSHDKRSHPFKSSAPRSGIPRHGVRWQLGNDRANSRIRSGEPRGRRELTTRKVNLLEQFRTTQSLRLEAVIAAGPFALPRHWPRIVGLDIGIDHPTAAAWIAWDRDTDVAYLYDAHRQSGASAAIHAAAIRQRGASIPVAWPHDAASREAGSGETMANLYRSLGLNMLKERATFPDSGNSVEAGIMEMTERMQTGRFKVFRHLTDFWDEFRTYHRRTVDL